MSTQNDAPESNVCTFHFFAHFALGSHGKNNEFQHNATSNPTLSCIFQGKIGTKCLENGLNSGQIPLKNCHDANSNEFYWHDFECHDFLMRHNYKNHTLISPDEFQSNAQLMTVCLEKFQCSHCNVGAFAACALLTLKHIWKSCHKTGTGQPFFNVLKATFQTLICFCMNLV